MGTGYTRADVANNIADGNIVNASDLDNEYDAIEAAFNSSTGHTHDGTAAEGGAITVVGPVQDLVVSATEVKPKTTNTLDLGTSALLYKDAYLQGNMYFRDTALKIVSSADGQLDIDADVELELVAPTVDIDASTALTVDTASTTFTSTLFNVTGSANITGDLDVDNINIDGNTIISTDTNGAINITPNGTGAVNITATTNITGDLDVDNININGNTIISTDTNGDINISPDGTGTVVIDTDLDVDNINVNGNTVSSTDTNGDINLSPNGTGTVVINTDLDVDNININGNTIISTDTNGNIALTPNGTGEVDISKVDIASGEIDGTTIGANSAAAGTFTTLSATTLGSAVDLNSQALTNANIDSGAIDGVTLGTNSAVTEAQVDNININGNTISSTDTNGNITLTPNGTGEVDISKVDIDSGAIDGTVIGASSAAAITGTTITGTSFVSSGDMTFGDNDKAIFGAGSDLEIYHDGSNSYIVDTGTGGLFQKANAEWAVQSQGTDEYFIRAATNAWTKLYYNGSEKLATTSTGIDINSDTEGDIYFRGGTGATRQLKLSTFATGSSHAGHDFDIASGNGVFSFSINGSEHMRIDSSGNVGIGTTSPARELVVNGGAQSNIAIQTASSGSAVTDGFQIQADGSHAYVWNYENTNILFATNNIERMRIDSSGIVKIGTTGTTLDGTGDEGVVLQPAGKSVIAQDGNVALELHRSDNDTIDRTVVLFRRRGSLVGSVSCTTSATAYNTSSDYRLKENVTATWDATTRLKQLNPVRFNFIENPDKTVDGFLAHEVQDVVPEAITGTKDAMMDEEYEVTPAVLDEDGNVVTPAVMGTRSVPDYQGIDQSKLVPLLVKTIQELEARIAALEAN